MKRNPTFKKMLSDKTHFSQGVCGNLVHVKILTPQMTCTKVRRVLFVADLIKLHLNAFKS